MDLCRCYLFVKKIQTISFDCFLFPLDMQVVELCRSTIDRTGVLYSEASEIVRLYLRFHGRPMVLLPVGREECSTRHRCELWHVAFYRLFRLRYGRGCGNMTM